MIDKRVATALEAVAGIHDGATVLVGGFGESGVPTVLLEALVQQGATDLTIVANNAGTAERGIAALLRAGRVRRMISSYPRSRGSVWFEKRYTEGSIELEVVPQGTLTERIRAAGAGIPAFFTPTAVGTEMAEGKEVREFGGRPYLLEYALPGDVALIRARRADRWGNLTYHSVARNYAPTMAAAATLTIAETEEPVSELGGLGPEEIITPGIYVDRVVHTGAALAWDGEGPR
ncbi:MAG TPA: 3-oxoacid CoA-transferase subunit A [Streptosporangiaceae bacterium]|nr:3-oxoacid CoA-transferase subunit A [Streptosporangiaceae bacterium]